MAELSRLPGPVTERWDWQMRAACAGLGTEGFFHPEGERGPARNARDAAAKAVCARCPVIAECGAHALAVREPYGVWGGMSEDDRDAVLGRGRMAASAS
jgi:WhiB family transcriptional regulator, redox-sensing transcriptional regulator